MRCVCAKPKLKRKQIIPNSAFVYELAAVPGTQSVLTGGLSCGPI